MGADVLTDRRRNDAGFTMLELVVVMSIAGVLMTVGIFGFRSWQNMSEQQGTADRLVSQLRNAATKAVSEGRTYCVEIAGGTSHSLWRYSCNTAAPTAGQPPHARISGPTAVGGSHVQLAATSSVPSGTSCPTGSQCLYFYPRGTATPATVVVSSTTRPKTNTIRVEGLTARVYV